MTLAVERDVKQQINLNLQEAMRLVNLTRNCYYEHYEHTATLHGI